MNIPQRSNISMTCIPLLWLALHGCASGGASSRSGSDVSNDPFQSIVQAAARGDQAALAELLEGLASDDPAVRMVAFTAIERMTGEPLANQHYERQEVRDALYRQLAERLDSLEYAPVSSPTAIADGADDAG